MIRSDRRMLRDTIHGFLHVVGNTTREDGDVLLLQGSGPDMVNPYSVSRWTLEVRVTGPQLTVRFVGSREPGGETRYSAWALAPSSMNETRAESS